MVDLTFLKKFTKNDAAKMARYISLYLDIAPKTFREMNVNFAEEDWDRLRINAHSLKPQAEFMGASQLKKTLEALEEAARNKRIDQVREIFPLACQYQKTSTEQLRTIYREEYAG